MKIIVLLLLVFLLLASCAPKEVPKADDFAFVFEEYSCGGSLPLLNVLDTSTGILIHTPQDETEPVEIPLVLSEGQMETIYQEIISTNYFDYPAEVRVRGETPADTFRLQVRNGDLEYDVLWTTDLQNVEPNFPDDDGLVELFYVIRNMIHNHPEYPKSEPRCA